MNICTISETLKKNNVSTVKSYCVIKTGEGDNCLYVRQAHRRNNETTRVGILPIPICEFLSKEFSKYGINTHLGTQYFQNSCDIQSTDIPSHDNPSYLYDFGHYTFISSSIYPQLNNFILTALFDSTGKDKSVIKPFIDKLKWNECKFLDEQRLIELNYQTIKDIWEKYKHVKFGAFDNIVQQDLKIDYIYNIIVPSIIESTNPIEKTQKVLIQLKETLLKAVCPQ